MGKNILYTKITHISDDTEYIKTEYYDDGTYSSWLGDRPTVEYSLWEVRDGEFWFKHEDNEWETLLKDNRFYLQSKETAEALMALDFLEKVIADD